MNYVQDVLLYEDVDGNHLHVGRHGGPPPSKALSATSGCKIYHKITSEVDLIFRLLCQ